MNEVYSIYERQERLYRVVNYLAQKATSHDAFVALLIVRIDTTSYMTGRGGSWKSSQA